jgi:type I restriction enzyme S subunit
MNYPPYKAYKNSGVAWVGHVPKHWTLRNLRYSAKICNGSDFKHIEVPNGGYPVLGSGGEFARVSTFLFDKPSVLLGRKGTMVHITKGDLGIIKMPIPNKNEQRAIATFLNSETAKIDALVYEAQKAIALLQERRQAIIFEAVTGKIDVRKINEKE